MFISHDRLSRARFVQSISVRSKVQKPHERVVCCDVRVKRFFFALSNGRARSRSFPEVQTAYRSKTIAYTDTRGNVSKENNATRGWGGGRIISVRGVVVTAIRLWRAVYDRGSNFTRMAFARAERAKVISELWRVLVLFFPRPNCNHSVRACVLYVCVVVVIHVIYDVSVRSPLWLGESA